MKSLFFATVLFLNAALFAAEPPRALAMSEAEAISFCEKWLPHWVGGAAAVEKLLTFYTDDAVYEDPNVPQGVKGQAEVGGFLKLLLGKYPDWKFEIVSVYPTPKGFILQYLGTVPQAGGKTIKNFRGIDVIEFEGNKISKQQGYYDRHVFFE